MALLRDKLQKTPIDAKTRREIVHTLWPPHSDSELEEEQLDWEAYFTYYTQQCRDALHDQGRHVLPRTHQDVVDIAQLLKEPATRDQMKDYVRSKLTSSNLPNEKEVLENSVDLAARLLLMMDIGVFQYGYSGRPELVWRTGSLRNFVDDHFEDPQVLGDKNIKLENIFTARNLGRIAGIQIEWTDNLADHLRMGDEDKKVFIFGHASFLKWQQKCSEQRCVAQFPEFRHEYSPAQFSLS